MNKFNEIADSNFVKQINEITRKTSVPTHNLSQGYVDKLKQELKPEQNSNIPPRK